MVENHCVIVKENEKLHQGNGEINHVVTKSKSSSSSSSTTSKKDIEKEAWEEIMGHEKPWKEYTGKEKTKTIFFNTLKTIGIFAALYIFICSLELLSSAFTLISGRSTGALMNNEYITNPVVGLMVGILLTVLVQSSSTSTSIIVAMVASGLLEVHDAIPMVMGANIGTSVTNTIVSMTQVADREQFRRAFSGATVHDMFNWMSVFVLLPLEIITGVLEALTGAIVDSFSSADGKEILFLETITSPVTDIIIQLNNQVTYCWGIGQMDDVDTMILEFCDYDPVLNTTETPLTTLSTESTATTELIFTECLPDSSKVGVPHSCTFIFYNTGMDDQTVGILLLVISLVMLVGSLLIVVKLLNTMLKGSIAILIKKVINADIPYVPWLTGYIAMLIGAVMTFLVQSSSVFTSTLTPLIGLGIISVERAYPMTLGSNIGTTSTALLAAMAQTGSKIDAIQIALVHLFFNIFGIMLWYPIPFMRIPIPMCKFLGNTTAKYRWFAIFYLVAVFFFLPLTVFSLSLGPLALFWGVMGPVILLILLIALLNVLQNKKPSVLPRKMRNWEFLPLPLRSLEPYDKKLTALPCCGKCRDLQQADSAEDLVIVSPRWENGSIVSKSSSRSSIRSKGNSESKDSSNGNVGKNIDGVDNLALELNDI